MNYVETMLLLGFLREKVCAIGLPPMYKWNIPHTWEEYDRWATFFGYDFEANKDSKPLEVKE